MSKAERHAKNIVSLIGQWLKDVWFLRHLRPAARGGNDKRSKVDSAFRIQVGPARPSIQASITAIGIDGTLEGNRAHSIYPDDIETELNTQTPETRLWLFERCGEFKDILYPDNKDLVDPTECCVIGTFHHEESVYERLSTIDYLFRTWPLCCPQRDDQFINLAPMIEEGLRTGRYEYTTDERYEDRPLLGHRFKHDDIVSKRKSRSRFDMQHMLKRNVKDTSRYPLRLSDLIVMDVLRDKAPVTVMYGKANSKGSTVLTDIPHLGTGDDFLHGPAGVDAIWSPYARNIGYIDPAGRGDRTGLCCLGVLNGLFFVKGLYGLDGGKTTTHLADIARLLRQHNCREVWYENNNDPNNTFGPALETELRKLFCDPGHPQFQDGWQCSLETDHATRQKELRIIDAIEQVAGMHRLVVDTSVVRPEQNEPLENAFQHQYSKITKDRGALTEDAKLDALAGALRKVSDQAGTDPDKSREAQLDGDYERDSKMLKKLRASQMGAAPDLPRWYRPSWETRPAARPV